MFRPWCLQKAERRRPIGYAPRYGGRQSVASGSLSLDSRRDHKSIFRRQIVITAIMLHAVKIVRAAGFYKLQTQHQ